MDTRERHQHIRILERCADINNDSTTFDVRWALTDLIKASIPEANLRETFGLNGDPCHILSFNMPEEKGNWVVIIKKSNIQKYGRDCLMVYHLRRAIDFIKVNTSNFKTMLFSDAYEILCDRSPDILYRYDVHLSCEALVGQMLVHLNN